MLTSLAIRDLVLVDRLDLEFAHGLCVLTGETGAGKSILLDAVGLALGGRADRTLIRQGAARASVSAAFAQPADAPARALLAEHGIEVEDEDELVLRRVLGADGRSRAFVNDQPVSGGLLRRLGELLVEVHGQHEQQALLDPATQRALLDSHGRLEDEVAAARAAWAAWRQAEQSRHALAAEVERAASEEAYWRHVLGELDELAPEPGEEEELAAARARLMNREKLGQAIDEALALLRSQGGIGARLGGAERALERVAASAGTVLEPAAAAIERARVEVEEAAGLLERAGRELELEGDRLEGIEERLFALRGAARKHRVPVDGLAALRAEIASRIAGIEAGGDRLAAATAAAGEAWTAFGAAARELSAGRTAAAGALARAVMAELPPLKLDKARFRARLLALPEADWSGEGAERVVFEIATNPGQEPGPLGKIASGGELARLMLALKVVLARVGSTPCLVFDEVDSGIGGATADAVGERLARLGQAVQVLVVTHAPQVAARADHHWRVEKTVRRGQATVGAIPLSPSLRREEIARMLAGATITEAARAAAASLIARSA
jgi:DNA repair protein RecN (Recombination protein N)